MISQLLGLTGKNLKQKFFVGQNPTFGTPISINADPGAIAATEAMMVFYNNQDNDEGAARPQKTVTIVPSYLILSTDTVAASGTSFMISHKIDNKIRYSSGGSELAGKNTFVSQRTNYSTLSPKGKCYFGDIVSNAEGDGVKSVGQSIFSVQTASQVKGNTYVILWDGNPGIGVKSMSAEGYHLDIKSPVYLDPQCSLILQVLEASAATTAAKFHVEMGWYELDNFPAFS